MQMHDRNEHHSHADVADVIARMEQILGTSDHNDDESFNFDDYLESSSDDSITQISIDDHIIGSFRTRSMKRYFGELRISGYTTYELRRPRSTPPK